MAMTQHAVILPFQFQFSKLALRWEEYIALAYNEAKHISCGCISESNKKGDALMLYSNTSNVLIIYASKQLYKYALFY